MAAYPQLLTGAMAQYAFEKRLEGRAVVNRAADASAVVAADPAGRRVRWSLAYEGLTGVEFAAMEALFEESEGRLKTFTFLDPAANLLGWSEDLGQAAWHRGVSLEVQGGVAGPVGEGAQLSNTGQGWTELWQTIAAPVGYVYSFSMWARGAGVVRLRRFGGAASEELEFDLGSGWRRLELTGALGGTGEGVAFAVGVPEGGVVEVAGLQVEPQLVAGEYKKSAGRGGVYGAARFAMDRLESRVEAPEWIDVNVAVEARFED
jgi:hypothetical protein